MTCNSQTQQICFKRGDTISIPVQYLHDDDTPENIDTYTISCKGKHPDNTEAFTANIYKIDPQNGVFLLEVPNSDTLKTGTIFSDIQFEKAGVIASTMTFSLKVAEDYT